MRPLRLPAPSGRLYHAVPDSPKELDDRESELREKGTPAPGRYSSTRRQRIVASPSWKGTTVAGRAPSRPSPPAGKPGL